MIKNFFIRLFAYPFCLFIIYLGIGMITNFQSWGSGFVSGKQLIAGFEVIIIASIYIIVDILILIKEVRKSKK